MISLILAIIYLAFVGLGLPDALLGTAWPAMHVTLGADWSLAGIITFMIAGSTIIASLMSDWLTKRFGAALVTGTSVLVAAVALLGFSNATAFPMVLVFAVPYGLAAGSIDAALNNYVARHYGSKHMSWLHAFWGVGAVISPYIMGFSLTRSLGWQHGYFVVSMIQVSIAIILFASLPLWKKQKGGIPDVEERKKVLSLPQILKIKGVKLILPAFFAYCAVEATTMLWASTYLVMHRGIAEEAAASFGALFFWGIMAGRFFGGFIADKMGDRKMIRGSIALMFTAIILILIPFEADIIALAGLALLGLGSATVYPSIIHSTPTNFGANNAQAIIGVQMAGAYTGSTFMPLLFGLISSVFGIGIYPIFMLFFVIILLLMTELVNRYVDKRGEVNA